MKIAISGASGFIGSYLSRYFQQQGYGVVPLNRELLKDPAGLWQCLVDCEVVINLAGASINRRWSKGYKERLVCSRLETTNRLVEAINALNTKPGLFISASAVGIYPTQGCHIEDSMQQGAGFLADLCIAWEKAAEGIISPEVRVVIPRFGIVFSDSGGAFPKMVATTKGKVMGMPGNGKQSLSWITLEDLARGMVFLICHPGIRGAVNFTAPQSLTYREFTSAVSKRFSGMWVVPIPTVFLKLAMGEAASVLLQGQCAPPDKLLQAGFVFKDQSVETFLAKWRP